MPGAVARVPARQVGVNRIVAVPARVWRRDHLTNFSQNGRRTIATAGSRAIDHVALMGRRWTNLSIASGIFIRSLSVIGVAEADIPAIQPRNLIANKVGISPTRPPKDVLGNRRGHDLATVVCHKRTSGRPGVNITGAASLVQYAGPDDT